MLRIGKRIFTIIIGAAQVGAMLGGVTPGVARAESPAVLSADQLGADQRSLLEQEQVLLRQLNGAPKTNANSNSNSPTTLKVNASASSADTIISEVEDFSPRVSAPISPPISPSISPTQKVEDLIDQQARAALAKIADVKERGTILNSAKPTKIIDDGFEEIDRSEKRSPTESRTAQPSYVENVAQGETAFAKVASLSKELGSRDSEISNVRQELSTAQKKAIGAEARAAVLAKQVEALRAKLMVAETEVERLSRTIEVRNKQVIQQANANSGYVRPVNNVTMNSATNARLAMQNQGQTVVRERVIIKEGNAAQDLPVVVVTSDKANLRTGPGQDNSALMAVTKGNRLVVENKQGSWFRVFAPNGVRAWVSADNVELQRGGGTL